MVSESDTRDADFNRERQPERRNAYDGITIFLDTVMAMFICRTDKATDGTICAVSGSWRSSTDGLMPDLRNRTYPTQNNVLSEYCI